MRIAFIGHSYHFKTGSNRFLLDLLGHCGAVETFADSTWESERGGEWATGFRQDELDCVVV
ncbi:MAG: hypothetical protein ACREI7_04060, partial [Myxococcota bacterium]